MTDVDATYCRHIFWVAPARLLRRTPNTMWKAVDQFRVDGLPRNRKRDRLELCVPLEVLLSLKAALVYTSLVAVITESITRCPATARAKTQQHARAL